jgi:23S rRNA pseudouridine1911/1915/1917 synthase
LLLIAKDDETYLKLQKMIQVREIKRTYIALICGHLTDDEGEINLPIGRSLKDRKKMAVTNINSRDAITRYKLNKRYRSYDLMDVDLMTGRTHQIRVHFSHLGHPIFGDHDYGGREKWNKGIFAPERELGKRLLKIIDRQALHAKALSFIHPHTSKEISLESNPPGDLMKLLNILDNEGY